MPASPPGPNSGAVPAWASPVRSPGSRYSIRRQYALQKAHGNGIKTALAPQVPQPQKLKPTTWEPRRGASGVAPDRRRLGPGRASRVRRGKQKLAQGRMKQEEGERSLEARQNQRLARPAGKHGRSHPLPRRFVAAAPPPGKAVASPAHVWYPSCVTSNTITLRLRRPKAEIEAKAKPNLNAWVNQLIEQALGPRSADWNEHFDRPPSGRRFHSSSQVKRAER